VQVLEDSFCDGRPPFELVGVQLVSDVAPYEAIKLRVLNCSHTALAYLASMMGIEFFHDAVQQPLLRAYLQRLMAEEVLPNLHSPPGTDTHTRARTRRDKAAAAVETDAGQGNATAGGDAKACRVVRRSRH